jgi:rRNA-processing protein FCF1
MLFSIFVSFTNKHVNHTVILELKKLKKKKKKKKNQKKKKKKKMEEYGSSELGSLL